MSAVRGSHETYNQVFGLAYVVLGTNALLSLACLPPVVVLLVTDPARSWPLLAAVAPLCAPALVAASAVFTAYSQDGTTAVVRTFGAAWRRTLRPSLAVGALTTAVVVVLGVDTRAVWGATAGALAIPFFATLGALALATATLTLVGLAERPEVRVRDLLRAALYLAVRRWYLSAGSLVVLVLLATMVASRPVLGLGLAAAPLLYVVWANCRHAMRPVLPAAVAAAVPA